MGKDKWRYGVILDAGSSGTRATIYQYLSNSVARQTADSKTLKSLPHLETNDKWTLKTHPGVSTFGKTPDRVGSEYLEPLLEHALKYVPRDAVKDTPLFLLATAGVRLLPQDQRERLLHEICTYFQSNSNFLLPDCSVHVQVISGETEGLYGWVAANYLLGGFDNPEEHAHGKGHHTYGFLDMGGASAQIAFSPNATEAAKHANDLKLLRLRTIDGVAMEYQVFVTTWLGFGANEARRRFVDALTKSVGPDIFEIPDPCLPIGLKMNLDLAILADYRDKPSGERYLLGTGKFDECLRQTYPLLGKDAPCVDEPCLLNGVHVPAIDFDVNHFIGISEYWHTTHEIFEMGYKDKAYDFNTYQHRVKEFCEQDWTDIQRGVEDSYWGKKVDEQTAYEVCFKASWLISVLHDGIGIPRVGMESTQGGGLDGTKDVLDSAKSRGYLDPFQAVNKIKSTEVSWTLGKMVLYASSEIPPTGEVLPVGFGANVAGIPPDFEYPGGIYPPIPGSGNDLDDSSLTDRIGDTLFSEDNPRRIPGLVLLVLILVIAAYFLCGRERRARLAQAAFGSSSRGGKLFGMKVPYLLGRGGTNYHHLQEEGADLRDPTSFELGDIDSDESDDVQSERVLGRSTPRQKSKAGAVAAATMDRRGLAVRTESRENLDLGRKSRSGSPTRLNPG